MKTNSFLTGGAAPWVRRMAGAALALALAACAGKSGEGSPEGGSGGGGSGGRGITLISREEGSGTRSAFVELFGVLDEAKQDATSAGAEITNNTAVMIASVAGDQGAVGYISLGSLNDTVKALRIDGAEATAANVAAGVYGISRPFNIALRGEPSPQVREFVDFILSREGQDVVEKNGYIRIGGGGSFTGGRTSGRIVAAGSSSVTPVMEKLKEAYLAFNGGADIEIQQSDSSTGVNALIEGICDIGMASRELKAGEREKGVEGITIAMDGIAVIVNHKNPLTDLSKDRVRAIFTGEISSWEDAGR
ncbi:MAG: substrate-binding domain-containing protein [Treponema sp.]|jgi:phosphate transport system substrate-binding protein|nr:substrate-binding domain-containing protein [Treponema sp.]